jgi:mannitol/fructose-specific phosphotransferase system IIA component (Ntr-type)
MANLAAALMDKPTMDKLQAATSSAEVRALLK